MLRYTLVADGPSDSCLIHLINWVLRISPQEHFREFRSEMADSRLFPERPSGLQARIEGGFRQFPCDLLFVHRDAERDTVEKRHAEIEEAIAEANLPPYVPVVPVRMTEAWLLIDEDAVRKAAGNPNGTARITLPPLKKLENVPDPKTALRECLFDASETTGRRRSQFERRISSGMRRVATLIQDYSPLRQLPAFRTFEAETNRALARLAELHSREDPR